jgi:hypothetical protein
MSLHPNVSAAAWFPVCGHPYRSRSRNLYPCAGHPLVMIAQPVVISSYPDIIRAGANRFGGAGAAGIVVTTTAEGVTGVGVEGPAADAVVGRTTTFPPPHPNSNNVDPRAIRSPFSDPLGNKLLAACRPCKKYNRYCRSGEPHGCLRNHAAAMRSIAPDFPVGGDEGERLRHRLSDKNAVERVAVKNWNVLQLRDVFGSKRQ